VYLSQEINEVAGKEQYQVKISKKFTALKNLDDVLLIQLRKTSEIIAKFQPITV
jgi:hypothetical protein